MRVGRPIRPHDLEMAIDIQMKQRIAVRPIQTAVLQRWQDAKASLIPELFRKTLHFRPVFFELGTSGVPIAMSKFLAVAIDGSR